MFLFFVFSLAALAARAHPRTLVTFGDSYTDQSRFAYFLINDSFPPAHYQELYPPLGYAANGGSSWVRYAELCGNLTAFNYAVAGASCSNLLTPRPHEGPPAYPEANFPSVLEYEIPAYAGDWVQNRTGRTTLDEEAVYVLWIGTNDVGAGGLLTGNQTQGTTIVNVTECGVEWMRQLYAYGARRFILMNMIPLWLTPLYSLIPVPPDRYWPYAHDSSRTSYSLQIQELVSAGNALWDLQVPAALRELEGARGAVFSAFDLFWDIYHDPSRYLNGTAPLNITGYDAHSTLAGGALTTTTSPSPDSFMWYDSLHPSEQCGRVLAREVVSAIEGQSKYATYYNW
ncbi:carbohydrate esterase family 16 protein [Calocera viscosa TUFC12733]|uniref:Carbohydrate esterase family 16 protein n=1 Tax=Calocera viscosa (strain TUFC12733) TaxID=1330018 RepID=A0A167LZN0_CALVF|nr:carbohydrate esterase family 16 protein [Calocera viscosa TUFC12733]